MVSCLNRWTVTLYLPLQHQFRLSKNKACWQTFPYYDMVSGMLKSYESVVVLFCWGTTCTWLITTWLTLAYLRTLTYITANLRLRGQRPMYPSSCPDHPQTQASNGAAVFECWWGCMNLHTGAFKSFSGLASKKTSNKHCISNFLSRKEPCSGCTDPMNVSSVQQLHNFTWENTLLLGRLIPASSVKRWAIRCRAKAKISI